MDTKLQNSFHAIKDGVDVQTCIDEINSILDEIVTLKPTQDSKQRAAALLNRVELLLPEIWESVAGSFEPEKVKNSMLLYFIVIGKAQRDTSVPYAIYTLLNDIISLRAGRTVCMAGVESTPSAKDFLRYSFGDINREQILAWILPIWISSDSDRTGWGWDDDRQAWLSFSKSLRFCDELEQIQARVDRLYSKIS